MVLISSGRKWFDWKTVECNPPVFPISTIYLSITKQVDWVSSLSFRINRSQRLSIPEAWPITPSANYIPPVGIFFLGSWRTPHQLQYRRWFVLSSCRLLQWIPHNSAKRYYRITTSKPNFAFSMKNYIQITGIMMIGRSRDCSVNLQVCPIYFFVIFSPYTLLRVTQGKDPKFTADKPVTLCEWESYGFDSLGKNQL
jgi:hypothetical protein